MEWIGEEHFQRFTQGSLPLRSRELWATCRIIDSEFCRRCWWECVKSWSHPNMNHRFVRKALLVNSRPFEMNDGTDGAFRDRGYPVRQQSLWSLSKHRSPHLPSSASDIWIWQPNAAGRLPSFSNLVFFFFCSITSIMVSSTMTDPADPFWPKPNIPVEVLSVKRSKWPGLKPYDQ